MRERLGILGQLFLVVLLEALLNLLTLCFYPFIFLVLLIAPKKEFLEIVKKLYRNITHIDLDE